MLFVLPLVDNLDSLEFPEEDAAEDAVNDAENRASCVSDHLK